MAQSNNQIAEVPKHTAAPWFVIDDTSIHHRTGELVGSFSITTTPLHTEGRIYVASCAPYGTEGFTNKGEAEANARLIAAAPELLELAKHIIAMEDDAYFCEHPEWAAIVQQAFETFEKATGEKETAI